MPNKAFLYRIADLGDQVSFDWTAEIGRMTRDELLGALKEKLEQKDLATIGWDIEPYEVQFLKETIRKLEINIEPTPTSYRKS